MDLLADVLTALRVGTPVAAQTEAHSPWGLRFDYVTGAAFHVVLQGSCWLTWLDGDPDFEPIELGPGDVVLLGQGTSHALASAPGTPLVDFAPASPSASAHFGRATVPGPGARSTILCGAYLLHRQQPHPLVRDLPAVVRFSAELGRYPGLGAMVRLLGEELSRQPAGAVVVAGLLVDAMLVYMLRAWLHDYEGVPGWSAALADPATARALNAIHEEPARGWTVQDLAAEAGLSRAAFARRFTSLVGEPPLAYLTRWRMTLAARLLRDTDRSLGRIATAVGYGSAFAFAKAFRREYSTTPGAYRSSVPGTLESTLSPIGG